MSCSDEDGYTMVLGLVLLNAGPYNLSNTYYIIYSMCILFGQAVVNYKWGDRVNIYYDKYRWRD